jgi:outer membrane receptor protein involved in Fe transport
MPLSENTFFLYAAGSGLLLGLGTVPLVHAAADGCPDPPCSISQREDASPLEEIIVTGSHIHGADAAGSKLIVIGRDQIDASGYGRIEDVLATVTQNFSRTNAATRDGEEVNNYDNRGAEVQLRGLGVGTTLTLVNGQRQGASGYQGSFIDVSSIPASAVERIEILPEGSSALYGSDAIGGVVNIILQKTFEGFEARARGSTAGGDATERTLAGLWGHAVPDGHVLFGFQYDDSRALACSARAYCAANGDYRRIGGSDLRGVGGNPGTILDPITGAPTAAIPRGQDGSNLTVSQLIPGAANYTDSVIDNDILPRQYMRSVFLSAAYNLSTRWELSVDGRYSSRAFESTFPQPAGPFSVPVGNAFNHLGGPVLVAYDFTSDVGPVVDSGQTETSFISTGIKGALARGWQLRMTAAYSKSRTRFFEYNNLNTDAIDAALGSTAPATALDLFGDGSHTSPSVLAALRNQSVVLAYPDVFTTDMASVIADGPLFTGPAGPIRFAGGGDFRRERSMGENIALTPEKRGREVAAAFVELAVPLLSARTGSTPDRLGLSLAGRYDHYSDAGGTFNPRFGLSWRPSGVLGLRGNWGTSFRAPTFFWSNPDLIGDGGIEIVNDPKSPTMHARVLELFGTSKGLKPETSTAWSVGADVAPPAAPNLSLSVTYFNIDYEGKIRDTGTLVADFLTQEAQLASLITRNPTQAQIDAVCNSITFRRGSKADCTLPIAAIVDGRIRNLASVKTRGVDVDIDYAIDGARGKWTIGLKGTYTFFQDQQLTATAPIFDFVNTVGNPLKLRLAAQLAWSSKGLTVLTTVNHAGSYEDPGAVPTRGVDSWTTVDLNLGYRVDGGSGWLAHTKFNLGLNNALDQRPPFVNQFDVISGTFGYDPANASLLGRQASLQVVKRWGR